MGDKVSAKDSMIKSPACRCVPGSEGALPEDPDEMACKHGARQSVIR
jgi:hypothetical protein